MTVLTRFLLIIALLTLVGCTPTDNSAADSTSNQEADSQEKDQSGVFPSKSSTTLADKVELGPVPTLDLKNVSLDDSTPPTASTSPLSDGLAVEMTGTTVFSHETPMDGARSVHPPNVVPSEARPLDVTLPETTTVPSQAPRALLGASDLESPSSLTEATPFIPVASNVSELRANPLRDGETRNPVEQGMEGLTSSSKSGTQDYRQDHRPNHWQGNRLRVGALPEGAATAEVASKEALPEETASTDLTSLPTGGKPLPEGSPNSKGQPFDPIKENGPIFVDWPKPELVLVMTGRQNGYIEPCGCAGMDQMKGGLTRRDTMIKGLIKKRKWPVVALDIGNQVKGHKRQAELKFQHTTEALLEMGYAGAGLGIADLQLPAGELAAITSNENSPFVSANIDLFEPGTELIARYRIVEENGIKVGITAVLGDSFRKQVNNKSIPTTDPVAAIRQVAGSLKDCNVRVLLAYADHEESIALAKQFPMFNVIVTADGGPEPPRESVVIPGTKTYLIKVGEKGECAIVLGIYRDRETPIRYQRVTLDSRFAPSKKIHRLMAAYQDQLKMLGLEGLNIKPVPCPEAETKGKYVGSKACATCHEESYDIWRKSKHAEAWKTLVEAKPPRNHDPECISCHVIGWDPQRYYPFIGGFVSSEKTHELENVGCESCHGPGGAHIAAESGSDLELQERLQKAITVTIEESRSNPQKMCYNCHDLDNSPEFDFDKYWPEVEHSEEE